MNVNEHGNDESFIIALGNKEALLGVEPRISCLLDRRFTVKPQHHSNTFCFSQILCSVVSSYSSQALNNLATAPVSPSTTSLLFNFHCVILFLQMFIRAVKKCIHKFPNMFSCHVASCLSVCHSQVLDW